MRALALLLLFVAPAWAQTSLVGIVYYADDPDRKVFRLVTPQSDDSELDRPDPKYGAWTVFGVDPARKAVMEKVPAGDRRAQLSGGVNDPPTRNGERIR